MKKISIGLLLLLTTLLIPNNVMAFEMVEFDDSEEGLVLLSSETKYYKTITVYDNSVYDVMSFSNAVRNATSETIERTYEEYMNAPTEGNYIINDSHTIETEYKYITAFIYQHGSGYRYKNEINWKTFPVVRSYDITAIGFYSNVQPTTMAFQQYYCSSAHGCHGVSTYYPQAFSQGASAVFQLITYTDLTLLESTFYFDVEKTNPNSTVTQQLSSADYAHAIQSVGLVSALSNHEVLQDVAIILGSAISSKYDTSIESSIFWNGQW